MSATYHDLIRLNFDISSLALSSTQRLVNHDSTIRETVPLALEGNVS